MVRPTEFYEVVHAQKRHGTDYERTSHLKVRATCRLLKPSSGGTFVDIGCGDGSITEVVRDAIKCVNCIGIEISMKAAQEAHLRGVNVTVADLAEGIPLASDSVDVMLCGDVIEHLVDVDNFLREIYRVLAPGARCLIATPNLAWYPNRLLFLLGMQPMFTEPSFEFEVAGPFAKRRGDVAAGHLHVMTLGALTKIVRLHGFCVERVVGAPIIESHILRRMDAPWWMTAFQPLDRLLSIRPSLAAQALVLIRKRE